MNLKKIALLCGMMMGMSHLSAQSFVWVSSTEGNEWKEAKIKLQNKGVQEPFLKVEDTDSELVFKKWGTCFNELGWDLSLIHI